MYTRRYHDIKLLYIKMFDVLYMCAVYLYIFPSYKIEIHIHIHTVHESHVCNVYSTVLSCKVSVHDIHTCSTCGTCIMYCMNRNVRMIRVFLFYLLK